jgi:hypothetical protein
MLTGCEKMQMKKNKSYTTAEIDGVTYTSQVMDDWSFKLSPSNQLLDIKGDFFHIEINYTMTSQKGEQVRLNLRIKEDEAFELNKEYRLPSDPTDIKFFSNGKITVSDGELERYYYATDGSLLIESIESLRDDGDAPYVVNGYFEFTAKEEFSSDVINVTNGTFHRAFFTRPGGSHQSNWRG